MKKRRQLRRSSLAPEQPRREGSGLGGRTAELRRVGTTPRPRRSCCGGRTTGGPETPPREARRWRGRTSCWASGTRTRPPARVHARPQRRPQPCSEPKHEGPVQKTLLEEKQPSKVHSGRGHQTVGA